MQFKLPSSSTRRLSDSVSICMMALVLAAFALVPTSQQIFGDDDDDQDDFKTAPTTAPPSLTNLITLDKSKLDWTCNDDKNRALIHFNFHFNLTTTHAQYVDNDTDSHDNEGGYDEKFNIFYKYLSCHPANCKFIYLTSLNTTKENATLRVLLDNYYKYEFRFTYQRIARRRPVVQRRRSVVEVEESQTTTATTTPAATSPVSPLEDTLLCPSSTVSSPIKFGVCDQYEFSVHSVDDCSLILVKATPSGFVKYIYLLIVVVVLFVVFINLIKKIKFKYQIIKS